MSKIIKQKRRTRKNKYWNNGYLIILYVKYDGENDKSDYFCFL